MTARELIRKLENTGWEQIRQSGSHHIFKKSNSPMIISVPIYGHGDIKPGLAAKILKIAKANNENSVDPNLQ